jgi:hypothetical protein
MEGIQKLPSKIRDPAPEGDDCGDRDYSLFLQYFCGPYGEMLYIVYILYIGALKEQVLCAADYSEK